MTDFILVDFYYVNVLYKVMSKVNLYDALKSSYGDKKARQQLSNAGYKYDSMLSNRNQQVWYNPNEKKLLYNIAGTHNIKDWGTNTYLALGKLKDTNRYKEAKQTLENAKMKYGNDVTTNITGHSLGGAIAQYVGNKNDKVYTLDKGATIGQKTRSNETAFRTSGDIVSLASSGATRMTTLQNRNKATGFLPLDALKAHKAENIRKEGIQIS